MCLPILVPRDFCLFNVREDITHIKKVKSLVTKVMFTKHSVKCLKLFILFYLRKLSSVRKKQKGIKYQLRSSYFLSFYSLPQYKEINFGGVSKPEYFMRNIFCEFSRKGVY